MQNQSETYKKHNLRIVFYKIVILLFSFCYPGKKIFHAKVVINKKKLIKRKHFYVHLFMHRNIYVMCITLNFFDFKH